MFGRHRRGRMSSLMGLPPKPSDSQYMTIGGTVDNTKGDDVSIMSASKTATIP